MSLCYPTHIDKCKQVAMYSDVYRGKVAAMGMTDRGHVVAIAHNRRLSGHSTRFTQHAEDFLVQKLSKMRAKERFGHIVVLVIRVTSRGLGIAKPCMACENVLARYGCTVYYSTRTGRIEKLRA